MARDVRLRWEGKEGRGNVLRLPFVDEDDAWGLRELVDACKPATFGRDGKDIYDESYRRAGALGVKEYVVYPLSCSVCTRELTPSLGKVS